MSVACFPVGREHTLTEPRRAICRVITVEENDAVLLLWPEEKGYKAKKNNSITSGAWGLAQLK